MQKTLFLPIKTWKQSIKIFFLLGSYALIGTFGIIQSTNAQSNQTLITVTGGIFDAEEKTPIVGATIREKNSLLLIKKSDNNGTFELTNRPSGETLIFSHPDYQPREISTNVDDTSVFQLDLNYSSTVVGAVELTKTTRPKGIKIKVVDEQNRPLTLITNPQPKQSEDEIFVTMERSPDGNNANTSNWGIIDTTAIITSGKYGAGTYEITGRKDSSIQGNFLEFRKKGYQKNYLDLRSPDLIGNLAPNDDFYIITLKTEKIENGSARGKFLPLSEVGLDPIIKKNILLDASNSFDPEKNLGSNEYAVQQTFFKRILPPLYRLIGAVGIFYLLIIGVGYIFSNGESDRISKQKDAAIWIVVGLMVVSVSEFLGFSVLNPEFNILEGETLPAFQSKIHQIVRYIEYIGGGIFMINGVLSGYSIIFSTNEEVATNQKKFMINFALGVVFLLTAEIIVRVASVHDGISSTPAIIIGEMGGIINLILTFLAGASGFMLILASLYYVANFGNEEQTGRAKKIVMGSVVGLIIAFSSYVIANFLVI